VSDVAVDEDHRRELLTLQVRDRSQTWHAARALSDGTLRFLALAISELDPSAQGLLCFEEPENGIHPERIPAMVRLLKDLSVAPEEDRARGAFCQPSARQSYAWPVRSTVQ
jgi:predicted ATPase